MLIFSCSECGQRLKVDDVFAGKQVRCPRYNQVVWAAAELVRASSPGQTRGVDPRCTLAPGLSASRTSCQTPPAAAHAALTTTLTAAPHSGPAPPAAPRFDFLAPAEGPDELGRLGSYRIRSVLGRGGMGVVFSAENLILDRKVALKVLAPEVAVNPNHRRRFLREARLAASVEHEHVVTIYRADEENGVAFLEMPLLQGESLRARLRRMGTLPVPAIVRFGRETARGLQAAHDRPGNGSLAPGRRFQRGAPPGSPGPVSRRRAVGVAEVMGRSRGHTGPG
jgi:hypothetical protein